MNGGVCSSSWRIPESLSALCTANMRSRAQICGSFALLLSRTSHSLVFPSSIVLLLSALFTPPPISVRLLPSSSSVFVFTWLHLPLFQVDQHKHWFWHPLYICVLIAYSKGPNICATIASRQYMYNIIYQFFRTVCRHCASQYSSSSFALTLLLHPSTCKAHTLSLMISSISQSCSFPILQHHIWHARMPHSSQLASKRCSLFASGGGHSLLLVARLMLEWAYERTRKLQ